MSRRLLGLLVTLALATAAFAVAPAVALAGDPCFHEVDNRPAPSTGRTSQVVLGDCVFTPTVNSVPVGTTVTWRNAASQAHEVVGSNMTWGAHAKLLEPGDTIGWTFEKAGVYGYSCMIHPGMTGVIVVGDAAQAAAAGAAAPANGVDAATGDVDAAPDDANASTDDANGRGSAAAAVGVLAGGGGFALGLLAAMILRRREPSAESQRHGGLA